MDQPIIIEPITRIEGHGKISIHLAPNGEVADAKLHVTQFRGFETFCQGRPFAEMISLVERICGICPISHSLASAKACDDILGIRVPETAQKLRVLLNCGEFIQSHALSFFHLSGPDLILGMDAPAEKRNLFHMLQSHPEIAKDGIRLRQIGQQIIEGLTGKRIHPAWVVPGGVRTPLQEHERDTLLERLPEAQAILERAITLFIESLKKWQDEIEHFANFPTLFVALTNSSGQLEHVHGNLRCIDENGAILEQCQTAAAYQDIIGEASEQYSYLKSPFYIPRGYPAGMYRVGPAARLNVANGCPTPWAHTLWEQFRLFAQGPILSSFYNHFARLVEIVYCLETAEQLLQESNITSKHIRAHAQPNYHEGIGIVEAPRGTLIHHYNVNTDGLIERVNLIVATGNNNLAMNKGLVQVAKKWVKGSSLSEGAINRLQAVIRAFDPCLSCSTHAVRGPVTAIELLNYDGKLLDSI
ncbi:Ni/Fe hydrogenase subunit alpha [Desulfogranum japonicum]|uniref:Ni/Fe hydrogenase subunit alpha n=1 Tax=Desulfogranum japonicum TaxID=231447 RepID=UPI000412841B|nr:Ni/Fe hydrogenase subunit alpha [Desulfogranum japonicum]